MELNALQTLTGWIVYAERSTPGNGPIFPPREVLEEIVKKRAGRYDEAEAMARHYLDKLRNTAPETLEDTLASGARFVQGLDKKLGGVFGTRPVGALLNPNMRSSRGSK